ncbi:hypothetical protein E3U43_002309 [Larimichthys crocea]|uniref:Uncharacterized protein n=1 Tax=Larimichthys crocea TaxID=215358 RepID=A0ACD3QR94_LARCR|nr:hypothetical protein E3U43_002309 [Larimichthys crocea]
MGGVRVAFRTKRRAHQTLQEAHRSEAIQMQSLRQVFLPFGPSGAAHEEAHLRWPLRGELCGMILVDCPDLLWGISEAGVSWER